MGCVWVKYYILSEENINDMPRSRNKKCVSTLKKKNKTSKKQTSI